MTTTGERNRLDGQSATAELRAAVVVPPQGRRRPGLLVAGLAMVALGALTAIWLVSSSGHRVEVVMLAHNVAYGSVLRADDLATTPVAVDPAGGDVIFQHGGSFQAAGSVPGTRYCGISSAGFCASSSGVRRA